MFLTGQPFLYQPEAHSDSLWFFVDSPWRLLMIWLALINLAAFCAFGVDKWKAKRKERKPEIRRIPERNLFLCALLGGSLGAYLGMRVWHHKTRHRSFQIGIPAILIIQVAALFALLLYVYFSGAKPRP